MDPSGVVGVLGEGWVLNKPKNEPKLSLKISKKPGDPQIIYGGTCAKKLSKIGVVNFGKSDNYFGTFPFEFLGPGSFSKILKSTF